MLRESNAVSSEGIGESRGGLSVLGPTDHLHHGPCHPLTLQPLSSQQHARPGPLNGLHIQVLIEIARDPDHRHPGHQGSKTESRRKHARATRYRSTR